MERFLPRHKTVAFLTQRLEFYDATECLDNYKAEKYLAENTDEFLSHYIHISTLEIVNCKQLYIHQDIEFR